MNLKNIIGVFNVEPAGKCHRKIRTADAVERALDGIQGSAAQSCNPGMGVQSLELKSMGGYQIEPTISVKVRYINLQI